MKTLFALELKKLTKKRMNIIVITVWNRILVLLPYRAAQPVFSDDFYGYFGYPLGGVTFDVVTVRMFVYAVITLMCIPFVRKTWRKHQVA